jgi:magnesium transporter
MNASDITRPDKILLKGIRNLTSFSQNLYSFKKTEAKGKAELTFIGEKKMERVQTQSYSYNKDTITIEEELEHSFLRNPTKNMNYWLNFHGIHEVNMIEEIGELLQLDRLTIRQIMDTTLRSKVEKYDDYLFLSVKSILQSEEGELKVEQISFLLGPHFVISFQEEIGDHFGDIRNKLKENLGFIRKRECDYLMVQLMDAILDNYFETIDQMNAKIAIIEDQILRDPDKSTQMVLENYTKSSQIIKKALVPIKEALLNIVNGGSVLIKKGNTKYFKDVAHSATSAMEEIDSTLKTLESLKNIYFASLSQKMNETMKVLTTVATVFIPLTFIAGIYGMNFENMPELRHPNGYFVTLGVMAGVAVAMLIYFRIKKWM